MFQDGEEERKRKRKKKERKRMKKISLNDLLTLFRDLNLVEATTVC